MLQHELKNSYREIFTCMVYRARTLTPVRPCKILNSFQIIMPSILFSLTAVIKTQIKITLRRDIKAFSRYHICNMSWFPIRIWRISPRNTKYIKIETSTETVACSYDKTMDFENRPKFSQMS